MSAHLRHLGGLVAALALAAACDDARPVPVDHSTRQRSLSEQIVGLVRHASTLGAEHKSDLALALAEVSVPSVSGRLRHLVAGEDAELAAAAATALSHTLHRREGAAGLVDCWKTDTNEHVRAACLRLLRDQERPALEGLVKELEAAKEPAQLACKAELAAPVPAPPALEPLVPLLSAEGVAQRRKGLRLMLRVPGAGAGDVAVDNALVRGLRDPDPQVALLAAALLLRQSIAASPPALSTAVPDGAMQ